MAAGKIKLSYFNIRGLAETSRYLLAVAGMCYENVWPVHVCVFFVFVFFYLKIASCVA